MRCSVRTQIVIVFVCAAYGAATNLSFATLAPPTTAPVDRVIQNVEARLKENPQDVDALYTLARAHYLAFINKSATVPVMGFGRDGRGEPGIDFPLAPRWMTTYGSHIVRQSQLRAHAHELALKEMGVASEEQVPAAEIAKFQNLTSTKEEQLQRQNWNPPTVDVDQLLAHAQKALETFKKLIDLNPNDGLYRLGLASFEEQYVDFRQARTLEREPDELKAITLERTLIEYYFAYSLANEADRAQRRQPTAGLIALVSYEAGKQFLEVSKKVHPNPTPEQQAELQAVAAGIADMDRIPKGRITPIIISVDPIGGLERLVGPKATVRFDLDGDGGVESWTWVKPTTGILVWDPLRSGRITSGRQMFGSATWWLLFTDGYRALDTLDDDRDGYVSGGELVGLAIWFDRNTNGISEPGEVVPIESAFASRIRALGTRPDGEERGGPKHSRGLILDSGQTLPTYDWIAERMGK